MYTPEEFGCMRHDIRICRELGCDGIVIGALKADGSIDLHAIKQLVDAAYPMGVTFHRAFDRCLDPRRALEQLIDAGCERILTSGQRPAAPEGIDLIAELQHIAAGRIIIMPGSGVRAGNIRELADRTGCTEFHSSLRSKKAGGMQFRHPAFATSEESYSNNHIDPDAVRALRAALMPTPAA